MLLYRNTVPQKADFKQEGSEMKNTAPCYSAFRFLILGYAARDAVERWPPSARGLMYLHASGTEVCLPMNSSEEQKGMTR